MIVQTLYTTGCIMLFLPPSAESSATAVGGCLLVTLEVVTEATAAAADRREAADEVFRTGVIWVGIQRKVLSSLGWAPLPFRRATFLDSRPDAAVAEATTCTPR